MEHIESWARDNEEKRLEAKVRGRKPRQRQEYLERVATFYLAEMGYNAEGFYAQSKLSGRKN